MPSKFSRAVRSSSQGEMGVFNLPRHGDSPSPMHDKKRATQITAKHAAKTFSKQRATKQPPSRSIFTIGSPENGKSSGFSRSKKPPESFGDFLQNCYLCRKELDLDKDRYMYGYLGAFCSTSCREDQMALDGFDKEVAQEFRARKSRYLAILKKQRPYIVES